MIRNGLWIRRALWIRYIRDLELYCKHGVYPEETFLGQKFL